MATFLVSIYPALATAGPTDPVALRTAYSRLHATPEIGAVELPLDADGQVPDEELVLGVIPAHWDVVLTTVPGTMARTAQNAAFGLASLDARGGDEAVDHLRRCLATAARLNSTLGRRAVTGIAVVSAPRHPSRASQGIPSDTSEQGSHAPAERFSERLSGILDAGTDDIAVLVEHCDAAVAGRTPVKGFLNLADEIDVVAALRAAGHPSTGVVVNWGRSALETRSVRGPVEHVERARQAGVLHGVVLSGCADREGAFGPAWADAHTPLRDLPAPAGEPTSLLTEDAVRSTLDAAGRVDLVGVKVAVRPHNLGPAERAAAVTANVDRVLALTSSRA